jgi:hypothetical protein
MNQHNYNSVMSRDTSGSSLMYTYSITHAAIAENDVTY